MKFIKLIRPHQWAKNVFVFLPIFFSGRISETNLLIESLVGFIIFSLTASSIYIINDYVDIESDKNHPTKKNRPLASGAISKSNALTLLFLMLVTDIALMVFFYNPYFISVITAYFIINLAYSFKLKHIAILDISIIALGFLLRVVAGGYITGIYVSHWTLLLTFFLALIMAIGKRRGELINLSLNGQTRKSLDGYNLQFTDSAMVIVSTVSIMCYIMYTLDAEVQRRLHHLVIYTVIFVVIGVLRYLQQTMVLNKTESPTKVLFEDHFLQLVLFFWVLSFFLLIYFK